MSPVNVFFAKEFDPWLNLATEDWLFRDMDPSHNVLFLWRNSPTVVIGRYQNPWQECNLKRMEKDKVKLARRQSGGGAVFHDLGNTNFTFISSRKSYCKERNNSIIISALANFGIPAEASGRNDMTVDGKKFSGSAFKLSKDRAFHHGTILINTNINRLGDYLTPDADKLKAKGIKSVQARVTNLYDYDPTITNEKLCSGIVEEFFDSYGERCDITELSYDTISSIPHLQNYYEKMIDWNWRYGKTPDFEYEVSKRFEWGKMNFHFNTKQGKIKELKIFSDALVPDLIASLMNSLVDVKYDKLEILRVLARMARENPEHTGELKDISVFLADALA